jgi:eukaryotic-like serine/threonine-protein kinase
MGRWLLRAVLRLAYVAVVAGLFVASAYLCFSLFVRRGVTPIPNLVGLELDKAAERLADQGLRLRHQRGTDRFSDRVPPGKVLEQRPGPGSIAKRGGVVDLVLSRGRRVTPVPDLQGSALPAAQVTLAAAGLAAGVVATVFAEAPVGSVVLQKPAPGTEVGPGTPVRLFVAAEGRRQSYVMPDLVDRDYRAVRAFLEGNGFRIGSVKFEPYEGISESLVLRQFPLPGHPLRRGEVISLVVAAVPEPVPLALEGR